MIAYNPGRDDKSYVGPTTVTVRGKGIYKGTKSAKLKVITVADGKKAGAALSEKTVTAIEKLKVGAGGGKVDLKWGRVAGATGYQVLVGAKPDLSDAQVVTVKGGSTLKATVKAFNKNPLVKGKTYYLKMRAVRTTANVNGKENTYVGIHSLRRTCKV